MARPVFAVTGIFCVIMGLIWLGQGAGLIRWPAESFMIGKSAWTIAGACLAIVGAVMVALARRRAQP